MGKMMKKNKRLLFFISTLILALALCPASSFGQTPTGDHLELLRIWNDTPCREVFVDSSIAYFANDGFFEIVDFHDPANPVELGRMVFPDTVKVIFVSDSLALLGTNPGEMIILDISQPGEIQQLGQFQHTVTHIKTISDIVLNGNLAYLVFPPAQRRGFRGISIVDISDLPHPKEVGLFYEQGARKVILNPPFLFLMTGGALFALDISADPTKPAFLSSIEAPNQSRFYALDIQGDFAYVLAGADIVSFNIADPYAMNVIGEAKASTGRALKVRGDAAFLVTKLALRSYDLSRPDTAIALDVYTFSGKADETVTMAMEDSMAYVTCSNCGLTLIDTSTPENLAKVGGFNRELEFNSVVLRDSLVFVGFKQLGEFASAGLWVMDLWSDLAPRLVAEYPGLIEDETDMVGRDSLLFVADWDFGLRILDISNPVAVHEVGFLQIPGIMANVAVYHDYAYMGLLNEGIAIIDISDIRHPVQVLYYPAPGLQAMALQGHFLYLGQKSKGLTILDLTNPGNPVFSGQYRDLSFPANDIAVQGNLVYVAEWWEGLTIIDVSDPTKPVLVSNHAAPGQQLFSQIAVHENYVYTTAGWGHGLAVFDASNPLSPREIDSYFPDLRVLDVAVFGDTVYLSQSGSLAVFRHKDHTVGIAPRRSLPTDFVLDQNYPNPFNPETAIRYALPRSGRVELVILNISGQVVRRLVMAEQAPGTYRQVWDGRDHAGRAVASGIYLCRLQVLPRDGSPPFVAVRKMALVR